MSGDGKACRRIGCGTPFRRAAGEEAAASVGRQPDHFTVNPTALPVRQGEGRTQIIADSNAVRMARDNRKSDSLRTHVVNPELDEAPPLPNGAVNDGCAWS